MLERIDYKKIGAFASIAMIVLRIVPIGVYLIFKPFYWTAQLSNFIWTLLAIAIIGSLILYFFQRQNIMTVAFGGLWGIYTLLNISFVPNLINRILNYNTWISQIIFALILLIVSIELIKNNGLSKMIGLFDFLYTIFYVVNIFSGIIFRLYYYNDILYIVINAIYCSIPFIFFAAYFMLATDTEQ